MNRPQRTALGLGALLVALIAGSGAKAQIVLKRSVIGSGGALDVVMGSTRLSGIGAQTIAREPIISGELTLQQGFWAFTRVAPLATLSIDKDTIISGDTAALRWQTQYAFSVQLNNDSVSLDGSKSVMPEATTTYMLIAIGPGGADTAYATIVVNPKVGVYSDDVTVSTWLHVSPNPARDVASIIVRDPRGVSGSIVVRDLRGVIVRTIPVAGESGLTIQWNGTDDNDVPMPSGVYIVTYRLADRQATNDGNHPSSIIHLVR